MRRSEPASERETRRKGFVISLDRRPDRLAEFKYKTWSALKSIVEIHRQSAIDGASLEFDAALRARVNPWNFQHCAERKWRGIVGTAMSHLVLFERIGQMTDDLVFVFEDDARIINLDLLPLLSKVSAEPPEGADLIWLNDYHRGSTRFERIKEKARIHFASLLSPRFIRWQANTEKTTEAYMISPRLARVLVGTLTNDLGAIDEHMRAVASQPRGLFSYYVSPPIFTQADRADTDAQFEP